LADALKAVPEIVERYDVLFSWAPVSWVDKDLIKLAPELWARCTVLWQELEVDPPAAAELALRPAGAITVTFPPLWLSALWPAYRPSDLFLPGPDFRSGEYPYNDPIMMTLADTGLTGYALSRRYNEMAEDWTGIADRLLEQNMQMMATRDNDADVAIGGFIMARFAKQNMFSTANHPRAVVLRELLTRMAQATWPRESKPLGPYHRLGDHNGFLRTVDALRMYDQPVSPWTARHWGLSWWSEDLLFRIVDGTGRTRSFTFAEYLGAYVDARRRRLAELAAKPAADKQAA
jgi:hypothetical protein